ncbi:MAG TPA: GTPase HflX [Natrialbaceae archaeon]|nr:GTPase HflX [Natrialbaceae archaeon]
MTASNGTQRAVIAARRDESPVDTEEIRGLAEAAGYAVVDDFTQTRPEDPGTNLGAGKVQEITTRVAESGADALVIDDELTPQQTVNLREAMPDETAVLDRYRLVLDVFADGAETRRAQLQMELARLQYRLPRIRAASDEGLLNRVTESGTPLYDVRDRIDELERKLDALPDPGERHREARREQGFDLVAIAGYTNAGKSTLLHRIADDLSLGDAEPDHPDREATAPIEDRLFKTLRTTTRRGTIDGRPVLFTDTVGFVSDLPHWLVESFSSTLMEVEGADCVLLVADATDGAAELRSKLETALSVLDAQGVDEVITVLNKIDAIDEATLAERRETIEDLAPDAIPVSVREGTNVEHLTDRLRDRLPTETATLEMPNCDEAMGVISWAHDHGDVRDVEYGAERVRIDLSGRPDVVSRAQAKADGVGR